MHAGYTVRVPYALLAAACAIGFPSVVEGWRLAPSWLGWTAFALLAIYVVAAIGGTGATLGAQRAGAYRDLVYLADLALGIATVGLILGLWRDRARERLLTALHKLLPDVPESQANFVWLPLGDASAAFGAVCEEHRVIVRVFQGDGVRVTVGTPEENDAFLTAAEAALSSR